jgi:excisionase family DNA binding protein
VAKTKPAPGPPTLPPLNSIRASADLLAVSTDQVKQLIRDCYLRAVRIGRVGMRVPSAEIERFINSGGVH